MAIKIPVLKKDQFEEHTGIVPKEFTRSVTINNFTTNLLVVLKLNHKKNSYEITSRLLYSQVTDNRQDNSAILMSLNALTLHAIEQGEKWRLERSTTDVDKDQIEMGFTEDEILESEEIEAQGGRAKAK